jgi:hypothetical protein
MDSGENEVVQRLYRPIDIVPDEKLLHLQLKQTPPNEEVKNKVLNKIAVSLKKTL